jgi:predicted metal-dependent enzyme (double-stranded beta helix superfamily)
MREVSLGIRETPRQYVPIDVFRGGEKMKALTDFAAAMDLLWAQEPSDERRWGRVRELLPILLDDATLKAEALTWPLTATEDGRAANLLLYEDPKHGFVVNALVKGPNVRTPVHDHAHTWTAYGVIAGTERVVRYEFLDGDQNSDQAELRPMSEYDVSPGFIDVVPPNEPHAEFSGDERTVAIIVRSERIGGFPQNMYDLETGGIARRPGPTQIPFSTID